MGGEEMLGEKELSMALIEVSVWWVYTCPKTHWVVYIRSVLLFTCQSRLNKVFFFLKFKVIENYWPKDIGKEIRKKEKWKKPKEQKKRKSSVQRRNREQKLNTINKSKSWFFERIKTDNSPKELIKTKKETDVNN